MGRRGDGHQWNEFLPCSDTNGSMGTRAILERLNDRRPERPIPTHPLHYSITPLSSLSSAIKTLGDLCGLVLTFGFD